MVKIISHNLEKQITASLHKASNTEDKLSVFWFPWWFIATENNFAFRHLWFLLDLSETEFLQQLEWKKWGKSLKFWCNAGGAQSARSAENVKKPQTWCDRYGLW